MGVQALIRGSDTPPPQPLLKHTVSKNMGLEEISEILNSIALIFHVRSGKSEKKKVNLSFKIAAFDWSTSATFATVQLSI